jgi:AraC family transcriptional activator of tynA and feaB
MAIVYSTTDVPPHKRTDYWNDVVARFASLTVKSADDFNGKLVVGSIASLGVSTFACDPLSIHRGGREIASTDVGDYYFICLQQTGRSTNHQNDRKAVVEPGGFFLIDPRRPFVGHLETQGSVVSIKVARTELEARTGPTGPLITRTLTRDNPVAALAFGFLALLPDRIDTLDDTAAPRIVEQVLDLVALAFSSESEGGVTLSSPRAAALTMLKAVIESRLHDPNLKPGTAATAAGISVRYANALLAQEETGLEAYIFARRLERCRRALDDPAQARRTVGDIAFSWGFSDLSHFGRRFKTEFGCSPGEYRKQRTA